MKNGTTNHVDLEKFWPDLKSLVFGWFLRLACASLIFFPRRIVESRICRFFLSVWYSGEEFFRVYGYSLSNWKQYIAYRLSLASISVFGRFIQLYLCHYLLNCLGLGGSRQVSNLPFYTPSFLSPRSSRFLLLFLLLWNLRANQT